MGLPTLCLPPFSHHHLAEAVERLSQAVGSVILMVLLRSRPQPHRSIQLLRSQSAPQGKEEETQEASLSSAATLLLPAGWSHSRLFKPRGSSSGDNSKVFPSSSTTVFPLLLLLNAILNCPCQGCMQGWAAAWPFYSWAS